METTYIALGITPSGNALVLRPIVSGDNITPTPIMLCDLMARGSNVGAILIGHMLIAALGAFCPKVDTYHLLPEPPTIRSFPTSPPEDLIGNGDMRALRVGLGLGRDNTGPALAVSAYDGCQPVGEEQTHSLALLNGLGKSCAPSIIGKFVLQKLAAMHPDVLAPLFPAMGQAGT